MRIAISNISWDVAEDEAVAALLKRYQVDAIDIAPGKYFPQPAAASDSDVAAVCGWWVDRGVEITGMQSLLFGTTGLNLFGSPDSRHAMLSRLDDVCRIAGQLGARRLVFGSPKNRDRGSLSEAEAVPRAVEFFRRLGDVAAGHGVTICLEPNPEIYGANFMTDSHSTAEVIQRVDHPAIRMQLDIGAIAVNQEDIDAVVPAFAGLIGHIHLSEPHLVALGDGGVDHARAFAAISQHLPAALVCIEMVATQHEPHLVSIERALDVAVRHYRPETLPRVPA